MARRRKSATLLAIAGLLLVVGGVALGLHLWRRWRVVRLEHPNPVLDIAFTAAGDQLVTLQTNELRTWCEPSGGLAARWPLRGFAESVAVAPRGDLTAVGRDSLGVTLYDAHTGARVPPLPPEYLAVEEFSFVSGPADESGAVRFSPSGTGVAFRKRDGSFGIETVPEGRTLLAEESHVGEWCSTFAFLTDDSIAIVGSGGLTVWSIEKQAPTARLEGTTGRSDDALSPRGTLWASWPNLMKESLPSPIPVLAVPSGARVGTVRASFGCLIAFSADDELVAVATANSVRVEAIADSRVVLDCRLPESSDLLSRVVFSPTADRLAIARGREVLVVPFRR